MLVVEDFHDVDSVVCILSLVVVLRDDLADPIVVVLLVPIVADNATVFTVSLGGRRRDFVPDAM